MSEKIKIVFNKQETKQEPQATKPEPQPKPAITVAKKKKGFKSHIKKYFAQPLAELINNDGVNDGVLIANPDALLVIQNIIDAILNKEKISIVQIIEAAAFEEPMPESEPEEEPIEKTCKTRRIAQDIEDEQDEDDGEDEDEQQEDYEEEDYEDFEEAIECDSYMSRDYIHDDEENMDD